MCLPRRESLLVFLIVALASGCAYKVNLRPAGIQPTINISNPIPLKAGLFIPEAVKSLEITDNPTLNTSYTFNVGEALESVIDEAANRAFTSHELLVTYPTSQIFVDKNLDLVGVAKVTSAMISLNIKGGYPNNAQGSTNISVQITFYTPEMLQLAFVRGSGMGIASEGMDIGTAKDEFSKSVEASIQILGDDLIQQIYGNYSIRKLADKSE